MEDKTFLRLLLLTAGFLLLMVVIMGLFSFILAFVFVLMLALLFTVLWYKWPKFHHVISSEIARIRGRIHKATQSSTVEYDTQFHPEYQLIYTRHGRNTKTVITKDRFMIGRKSTCDLVIADPSVSGEHCCIVYRNYSHEYYIEDLRSNNGTFMGVRRLEPFTQEKLLDNTEITISDRVYRFKKID